MPERTEMLPLFLDTAKEIGEANQVDTTIMEYDDYVIVSYGFQIDVPYQCFKRILTLADELSVQPVKDKIIVSLTYCGGRKINPLDVF